MNRLMLSITLCGLVSPAFAIDPPPLPAKPPTIAELQAQIARDEAALAVVIKQRDALAKALNDEVMNEAYRAAVPAPSAPIK